MLHSIEEGRAGEMSEEEVHKLLETYVAASPGPSGGLFTPGATSWM